MLSDLHDSILLRIMKFMNTKEAVQTCVLSSRWKNLWKGLTSFKLNYYTITDYTHFSEFVFWVLSNRDNLTSLHDIDLRQQFCIQPELVNQVLTYAVSHNVQKLKMEIDIIKCGYKINPCIFSCKSLTHLKLSILVAPGMIELPTSIQCPALKCLHLENVTFIGNDNGIVDPFSNCHMLSTLVLEHCYLHCNVECLCISNSKLSSLTIGSTIQAVGYKIVLSTPNLNYINLTGYFIHQVSICYLSFLEQVNVDVKGSEPYFPTYLDMTYSTLISWLQGLANYVKILTLSSSTLQVRFFYFHVSDKISLCLLSCQYTIFPFILVLLFAECVK